MRDHSEMTGQRERVRETIPEKLIKRERERERKSERLIRLRDKEMTGERPGER